MPVVNMVCSKNLMNYALNELNLEVEEIPFAGVLQYENIDGDIKIDLYDMLESFIVEFGTKTKSEWEKFFKVKEGRPNNIIYQADFDMILSELGIPQIKIV